MVDQQNINPNEMGKIAKAVARGDERDVAVGMHLRSFRDRWGVSRRLLADVAGVSYTTILRIENGERPFTSWTLSTVLVATRRIANTLRTQQPKSYDVWEREMIQLVAEVTQEKREKRLQQRKETMEGGA